MTEIPAPPNPPGSLHARAGHAAELRVGDRVIRPVGPARFYVCGITPYDVTHLGHAATFIWADVAASVLRAAEVDVTTCRNVTDVDDVLTRAADARGRAYDEFALYQEYLFEKDMAALGVHRPTHEPRARHHIRQVQQLAAALLAGGYAYQRDGHVYFRGKEAVARAGLDPQPARALSAEYGDEPDDPLRDDPFDVPVWRPSAGTDPVWPSPWGPGRPGWLLVLNRPWQEPWTYRSAALATAAADLEGLYAAAGRPGSGEAGGAAVLAALLDNLDVPRALAIARDEGGEAARLLLRILSLV